MKRTYSIEEFGVKKHETILSNGLKVVFIEKPFAPIYAKIEMGAGSIFNPSDNGLAHFTEHIIASASEKYPRKDLMACIINPIGGATNARTALTWMSVECEVALSSHLPKMKEYFSEVLGGIYMTPALFEKEQKVISTEITGKTSEPNYLGSRHIRNVITHGTVWAHSNLGTLESVKSLNQKEVRDFFETYCVVENMVLIVSGGCTLSDIEKTFESIQFLSGGKKTVLPVDPNPLAKNQRTFYEKDIDQTNISVLFDCPKLGTRESIILGFIVKYSHSGLDSRFYKKIRNEKGLAYSLGDVSINFNTMRYIGTYLSVSSDNVDAAISATIESYKELGFQGMSGKEIRDRIDRLYFGDKRNLQRSTDWVTAFDDCLYDNDTLLVKDYPDIYNFYQTITPEEVGSVLRKYLSLDNFHLLVHGRNPGLVYF